MKSEVVATFYVVLLFICTHPAFLNRMLKLICDFDQQTRFFTNTRIIHKIFSLRSIR